MKRRPRGDSGSVLMLVPAAVLVLLVLGAIAVDSAVVLLAQRDLANRTAGAANDIAGLAVSEEGFYRGSGAVILDQERATAFVALAFAADRLPPGYESWSAEATADGRRVVVEATARVRYVFARGVPGAADSTTVRATSVATTRGG